MAKGDFWDGFAVHLFQIIFRKDFPAINRLLFYLLFLLIDDDPLSVAYGLAPEETSPGRFFSLKILGTG